MARKTYRHYGGGWRDTSTGRYVGWPTVKRQRARAAHVRAQEARAEERSAHSRKGWVTRWKKSGKLKTFDEYRETLPPYWMPAEDKNRAIIDFAGPVNVEVLDAIERAGWEDWRGGIEIYPESHTPAYLRKLAKQVARRGKRVHTEAIWIEVALVDKPVSYQIVIYLNTTIDLMEEAGVKALKKDITKRGVAYAIFEVDAYKTKIERGVYTVLDAAEIIRTAARSKWGRVYIKGPKGGKLK